ncbi:unnamed protein product [Didymodactylos carnosus]|uniref:Cytochrome P450 n=1 Tax=Didymodactylos carnosus TaxID=1234261 RepID=A0A815UAQ4_9BILA|nr:unnamed protein product [Didymodactylos carnosus]CAF4377878.1 unnamed protein product [Didymodactylos carnosus]
MIFTIILAVLIVIVACVYYKLVYKQKQIYDAFRSQGIACEPFRPLVGQLPDMKQYAIRDEFMQYHCDLHLKHGNIYIFNFGPFPRVFIYEPELISDVLKKFTRYYQKSNLARGELGSLIGLQNLLLSDHEHHEKSRRMLQPAFHSDNLKSMVSIMSYHTTQLIEKWLKEAKTNNQFDLQQELSTLTLSVIISSAFGQITNNRKESISQTFSKSLDLLQYRTMLMITQIPFLAILPLWKKQILDQAVAKISRFVNQIILDRKSGLSQSMCSSKDLLDLLLSAKDSDGEGFTQQQIKEEALGFVIAGHETTGNLLTWCLYILMTHTHVYEACQDEVDQVLGSQLTPDYDLLSKLKVIDAVLHETLRLYPPAPILARQCVKEHTIGTNSQRQLRIPVGATIAINTYVLHRMEQFWPRPLEIDYTRWMNGGPKLAHSCCYLPFGAGNRNCIGQTFALIEAKVILSMLLQRLKFDIVEGQKIVPEIKITMRPKYGLLAKVTRRIVI